MNEFLPVVREILQEFLGVTPLKGARLKPLVVKEFERRTRESFPIAFYEYPKFSDLLRANDDLVAVESSIGTDIVVHLKSQPSTLIASVTHVPAHPYIQASLWHAFTNPDENRRRFYHRQSKEVVHFVKHDDPVFEAKVSCDPDYVEIVPISRADHTSWMMEFAQSDTVPAAIRPALVSIASVPYTSQLNRAFGATLERYAEGWRRFRTGKVLERVTKWAKDNDVSVPELLKAPSFKDAASPVTISTPTHTGLTADSRKVLHAVVDALDEAELANVLLPATVLLRIVTAQPK